MLDEVEVRMMLKEAEENLNVEGIDPAQKQYFEVVKTVLKLVLQELIIDEKTGMIVEGNN